MRCAVHRNRLGRVVPTHLAEFDTFFNHAFRAEESAAWRAPAAIWEAEGTIHVEVDAPGVAQDGVELTFDKGTLRISLERKAPEGERTNWHNERGFGEVTRSVSLPDTVDPETIVAQLNSGVLHVTIAKRPETQPKKIEVKVS